MEDPLIECCTSITHLPDDCLSFIFHWLDCSSDRDSFGLTCRHWLKIQNLNRRSLHFHCSLSILISLSLSQSSLDINLNRLLTRFQHLEHLSLSGCTELPDSGLTYLQYYGLRLQTLNLDCCFQITDNGLSVVANGCPSLSVISLYRCRITDTGLKVLSNGCLSLKCANLSYCSLISDSGLRNLLQSCRQLEAIKISNCVGIRGIGFKGCSQKLVYIDAESCHLVPEGVREMVSGGGLEYLNLSCLSPSIYGDGLAAIGNGFAAKLKALNLRLCRTVGDESIAAIAKGCPLLQEWSLALCHEVRIPGWKSIGQSCYNLEKLHVNRCRNLCDLGLQALRDGCKRLSVLYMNGNRKLSDTAVEMFKLHRGNVEISGEEQMLVGLDMIRL